MKTLILLILFTSLAVGQGRYKALADSAAIQTDIELFGMVEPERLVVLYVEQLLDKHNDNTECDCLWIVKRFEKYITQLDSGQITIRDLKSYVLDIKLLIKAKQIKKEK